MRKLIRAKSIDEALKAEGIYLSGGSEILRLDSPVDKSLPLIDILPLLSTEIEERNGRLVIGAAATFSSIISSSAVPSYLKEACMYMPSPELRNQATIGGNIAAWRDDSYLIPALAASDATLKVAGESAEMTFSEYAQRGGLILEISCSPSAEVVNFRESLTSHSHAVITASFGEKECYAVKGSGIFFSLDDIEYVSDMYGSAEYKKYLAELYRKEGGGR